MSLVKTLTNLLLTARAFLARRMQANVAPPDPPPNLTRLAALRIGAAGRGIVILPQTRDARID